MLLFIDKTTSFIFFYLGCEKCNVFNGLRHLDVINWESDDVDLVLDKGIMESDDRNLVHYFQFR